MSAPDDLSALSELGVLFLMFYIGLEFDLGKLRPVAGAAVLGLTLQTALMVLIGITAGQWLGWSAVEGLFLGGILAISSSMVCFKLIGERGEMHRPYAQLAAGVLILEDILAIVLLVVLAGVAVSGRLDVGAVGKTTFFVGMFVVAVFVIGKLLAPRLVSLLHKIGNAETVTLFTVGLIFAVSLLAAEAHFSLALGSFLAGAILSRSAIAHEIEGLTAPLRDFFSALFFVTIGTVIDPGALWEHLGTINELCAFTPEPTNLPHTFKRVMVTGASPLCGLTLREAGIRANYGVTMLGVQRDEIRRTGLPPDEVLKDSDLLLVMGREEGINGLREALLGA